MLNPSPNLRNVREVILYPCVGTLEGGGISVGRGTDTPFEIIGAPWMKGVALARELDREGVPGLRFMAVAFTPREREFNGERCGGVQILLEDREALRPVMAAAQIARAIQRLYPDDFRLDGCLVHFGRQEIIDAIREGSGLKKAFSKCQPAINAFRRTREKYLLY